jgi:RNA polymerase sigma factor (TIGR02999 family)
MREAPSSQRISRWLDEVREGRRDALDALAPLVYDELRHVAHAYMARERRSRTLQSTALVNEAFLRLLQERHVAWQNRAHFCAIAANAMRQILIERARARRAQKRGGDPLRVTLDEVHVPPTPPGSIDVLALHEALERLAAADPRRAEIVHLKYFGGMTIEEIAEVLGISPATVKRGWVLAKAWVKRELEGEQRQPGV